MLDCMMIMGGIIVFMFMMAGLFKVVETEFGAILGTLFFSSCVALFIFRVMRRLFGYLF